MGIELEILRELGTLSATLGEKNSIAETINSHIRMGDFRLSLNKIFADIDKCYLLVTENLLPLCEFYSEAEFVEGFDARHAAYTQCYLMEISKPRGYSEDAYEEYLLLTTMKEIKTAYPLLARSFERLRTFIDKWIDNDAWLAMSIDNLFKRLQALLNELATLKKKDSEDAFLIYRPAFDAYTPFLELLEQGLRLDEAPEDSLEQIG